MARTALGKGLSALIREPEPPPPEPIATIATSVVVGGQQQVDIDLIDPSPFQPRVRFREEPLEELAQSIRSTGIIQPLVLRPNGGRFQLLAGERRWRAAQRAGLTRVPAVIRDVRDEQALEITLVENIQREDLNPIEQARAFDRLMSEFHITQEDVATRTGKDRATVANAVRLLKLEPQIQQQIEEGKLSAGHGRALLAIADLKLRLALAQRAAKGGLTVRQLERFASRKARVPNEAAAATQHDANIRAALEQLERELGTRVLLRPPRGKRAGQIVVEYYDSAHLMGLYDRILGRTN
ncbi:MAG: ParB/RepB/Spo0J family partition protein [Candidatus Acidiferrales bacterium]